MNKIKVLIFVGLSVLVCNKIFGDWKAGVVPKKKSVRILTLNTALLTVFFEQINVNMKDNVTRARMIGETIREMNRQHKGPDIIVFQEAFDRNALSTALFNEIRLIYPYTFFDQRINAYVGGGVASGLALLSKYPIKMSLLEDYTCWAGVEALARKGIMGVELNIDGCPFYMFTTHLQAGVSKDWFVKLIGKSRDVFSQIKGSKPRSCKIGNRVVDPNSISGDEIRIAELYQAKELIDHFVKDKNAPIVLAGDFNISRTRDRDEKTNKLYYYELFKIFPGALDTYLNGSKQINSSSWDPDGTYKPDESDRVDYVLLLNHKSNITGKSDIINNFTHEMTDHLGIMATIEFECK